MKNLDSTITEAYENGVLRHRIRLWAHGLDVIMQTKSIEHQEPNSSLQKPLQRLKDALEYWKQNDGTNKPDIEWAENKVKEFSDFLKKGSCESHLPVPTSCSQDIEILSGIIKNRRSIRDWKDDSVSDHLIDKVLEAGLWAPSGCNVQPIRYYIAVNPDTKEYISSASGVEWLRNAPVIIIVGTDIRGTPTVIEAPNLNTGAAVQNMLLMASALSLGACWLFKKILQSDEFRAYFNVPSYVILTAFVAIGWPKYTPVAPSRICLDEVKLFEKWNWKNNAEV